jgi:hypothetical protein
MVNMVNLELPQQYMDALAETQIFEQKIQEVTFLKEGEVTLGETIILEATFDKQINEQRVNIALIIFSLVTSFRR